MIKRIRTDRRPLPSFTEDEGPAIYQVQDLLDSILCHHEIHDIEDVIDTIQKAVSRQSFLSVIFHQRRWVPNQHQDDSATDRLLFKYISFAIEDGTVIRFSNRESVHKFASSLRHRDDLTTIDTELFDMAVSREIPANLVNTISQLCTAFYITSDIHIHYIENTARRVARQIFPFRERTHDLPEITKFISKQFDVAAAFVSVRDPIQLQLDAARPNDFRIQFVQGEFSDILSHRQLLDDLVTSIKIGNDYSGRGTIDGQVAYYKFLPISIPARIFDIASTRLTHVPRPDAKFFPIGIFVILSRSRISRMCVATAKELLREIAGTKKIAEQLRSINDLHAEILDVRDRLLKNPFSSQSEALREFSAYAKTVASSIVEITSAHSATVRIYDPFRSALRPVAASFDDSLSPQSQTARLLRVAKVPDSVNAFVFSKTTSDFTYIANLSEIERTLTEQGLAEVNVARKESQCELCIRLSKHTVPIGTLNIEAPYAYALGKELLYCQAVARLLGEFYDVALKTSDSGWLPKISMSHIVYHRIQKVRRDHAGLGNILDFIESPIRKVDKKIQSEGEQTLTEIVERVERDIFGLSAKNFRRLVRCNFDKNILIREEAAASIAIIIETLIENCRTHASVEKDNIEITLTTRSGLPPGSCGTDEDLQIRIAYEARVARQQLDLLDKLTIAPVWQDEDRTYHFGMFLLGAHARLLGGVTYVDTEPLPGRKSRPVRIIVILPLASLRARQVGGAHGP
jgi:hypothetical protein